ncbi:calcium-binding protein [Vibrio renipiscarius]|uniref:Calcium-binding protein n=1 Tax=Vibrio renipiscarius TaxID=1461322 RepID=A0A0C2KI42_9VIBR|nr:calcium-binding protein [Vibrio renipiscarius]KII75537.1 hypothetical protein PL18_17570 [Vibrio renipiscarius]KII82013.1 hypothetical protein OJ16_02165 [Vibrio renipiscarius]
MTVKQGHPDHLENRAIAQDATPLSIDSPIDQIIVDIDRINDIDTQDGNDIIIGLGGNDEIHSNGGQDVIDGGNGNDVIAAGSGEDFVAGGNGHDRLIGENGNDVLIGDNVEKALSIDPLSGKIAVNFCDATTVDLSQATAFNPDGSEAQLFENNGKFGVLGNGESGRAGQIGYSFVDEDQEGDRTGASEVLSISVDEHSYAAQVSIDKLFKDEGKSDGSKVRDIDEVGVWTVLREGIVVAHGYFTAGEFDQATLEAYGLDPAKDNLKVLSDGNGKSNGIFTIEPEDTGFVAFDEIQFSAAIGHFDKSGYGYLDSSDFFVRDVKTVGLDAAPNKPQGDELNGGNDDDVLIGGHGKDHLVGDESHNFTDGVSLDLSAARATNPVSGSGVVSQDIDGVGVEGNQESGVADQLGHTFDPDTLEGTSETLTYDLGEDQYAARVQIDRLFADEALDGSNEVGVWRVFNDGQLVASGYFTSKDIDQATMDSFGIALTDNIKVLDNGTGSIDDGFFDITPQDTNGQYFDQIQFAAADGVFDKNGLGTWDSSDYFIKDITVLNTDSLDGSNPEGNDWLDGGAGNDLLEGGYGQDVLIGGTGNDILIGDYTQATAITAGENEDLNQSVALSPDGSQTTLTEDKNGFGVEGNSESGVSNQIGFSFVENPETGDITGESETLCISIDEKTAAAAISVDNLFADEAFNGANEVGVWTVFEQGIEVATGYFTSSEIDDETLATYGFDPKTDNIKVLENGDDCCHGEFTISPSDTGNATFDEIQLSAAKGTFDKSGYGATDSSDYYLSSITTYQKDDVLLGGEGHDIIAAGQGFDIVDGGAGHDLIHSNGNDYVNGGDGFDVVTAGEVSTQFNGELIDVAQEVKHAVDFEVTQSSKLQNIEAVVGSSQNDTLLLDLNVVAESTQSLNGQSSDAFFASNIEHLEIANEDFTLMHAETTDASALDGALQAHLDQLGMEGTVYSYTFANGSETLSVYSDVEWDQADFNLPA